MMKLSKVIPFPALPGIGLLLLLYLVSCSKINDPNTDGITNGFSLPVVTGPNVLTLTVNGSTCAANSYTNKPCVSVQICPPGSSTDCQTIDDVLVDTGSFGFRVYKSVLNPSLVSALTPVTSSGEQVAECVQYGDGSKDWGTIQNANIILGTEPAVQVPIQVIDSTYSDASTYCHGADTSPATSGFNAILGVGLFIQDCGQGCVNQAANGLYYACTGSSCAGTTVSLANQVQNPVASLPTDNNGILMRLPLIPLGGATSANGYLILGIGTQANNALPESLPIPPTRPLAISQLTITARPPTVFWTAVLMASFFQVQCPIAVAIALVSQAGIAH